MKKVKCAECGKVMKAVDNIKIREFYIKGWRCKKGHELFDLEEMGKVIKFYKALKKGLTAKVFKSGNSISVRIPKEVADVYGIKPGNELEIKPEKEGIELIT